MVISLLGLRHRGGGGGGGGRGASDQINIMLLII